MFRQLFKGSAYLLTAQSVVKAISFFYTLFLLARLSPNDFGLYVVVLSYFSLVSSFADFGINRYLIREIAVDKTRVTHLLTNVLSLRIIITLGSLVVLGFAFVLFDHDKTRTELVSLGLLACIPQAIAITFDSIYIGLQKFSLSASGIIFLSLITTLSGLGFVSEGFGVTGAIIGLIIGEIAYALLVIYLSYKTRLLGISPVKIGLVKKIVKGSLPYGFLSLLGFLYFKVDSLILNYMKGSYDTGIYGAAYKFLEAITFIPSSLSSVLFPTIASLATTRPKRIYTIYLKVTILYFGISLIVMVLFLTLLPWVITQFLPRYQESVNVIKILSLTIPFLFMIAPQSVILLSHQRYLKTLIYFSIFNLALNVLLNILVIPKFTYYGSAAVTVMSDIVGFSIYSIYIFKTRL